MDNVRWRSRRKMLAGSQPGASLVTATKGIEGASAER
jgi:hypothetical protein